MALPDLTAFELTKYAGIVSQEFNLRNLLRDEFLITRDLCDGKQCQIPVIVKRVGTEVAPGSNRTAGSGATEKSTLLQHQPSIEVSEKLPWERTKQLPWNIVEEYGKRVVRDVLAPQMLRHINHLAGHASTAAPDHVMTGAILDTDANIAVNTRDLLKAGGSRLDVQNLSREPWSRIMFLHPDPFNSLYTLGEVVRRDYGAEGGVKDFGMGYLEYGGWHIFQTPAGFATDSSALGDGNTPAKYKMNLAPGGLAVGGVYGVGWHKDMVAQGYATHGISHIEIEPPWYDRSVKSWMFNAALIWDTVSVQDSAGNKGLGIIRIDDDGV